LQNVGLSVSRIATGAERTPDYRLSVAGQEVIAEIKQLDPNDAEKADIVRFNEGKSGGYSALPGERIRRELSKANKQLAPLAKGHCPAIAVIYNNVFLRSHTNPYHVRVAMYGVEQVLFAVPNDPRQRAHFVGVKFGPKRKMTPDHNTTISAVGVLVLNPPGDPQSPQLIIYHNIYAKVPLDPELLRRYGLPQFTLPSGPSSMSREWIPV
jgi:hypothetical protein